MLRSDTLAFLQCVLPAEGYYCAVIFDTAHPKPGIDKPRHQFFRTVEELTDAVLAADKQGRTVFHACAAFKDATRRTGANARALRSLFLDVDAGSGKPYQDAQQAVEAVAAFCDRISLPLPVLVGSGNGLHCYWPLDRDLAPEEWSLYAGALKRLCQEHGLKADPARTSDLASILRPPGTYNRKDGGERLVQCGPVRQHVTSALAVLYTVSEKRTPTVLRQTKPSRRESIISRILSGGSYAVVYADTIADQCAQLAAFRVSGNLPEPVWHGLAGVLARCEDGDLKFHEWSARDYANYSREETQNKLDRARQLTGATTCAKLDDVNPGVCGKCPHWGKINSPISLGAAPAKRASPVPDANTPIGLDLSALPKLRGSFLWSTKGQLCFDHENNGGENVRVIVTDNPIYLESVQTSELDTTTFSFCFKKHLPKSGWHEIVVDAATLFGASGISTMFGKGVVVHEPKSFLQYVRQQVDDYHAAEDTETRYDQFGWKNDNQSFLYGKMLYTSVGPVEAIGAKEVSARGQWLGPKKGGSLGAWTEAADSLFASDMEATSVVVLASFAAVLMRFQSQDEGGAILHVCTPSSGQGKTTALTGAWTVWGAREGMSLTNEDTKVSKPVIIGTLANLPVIYDELRDKDPEVIKRMVVMFTEGRDRMRGTIDGTLRYTKAQWQTVMLSAANSSLIDQLQGDDTDAPAFRVLELEGKLPPNIDKSKGDRLKKMLTDNAGHAGDAYLRYLMHPEVLAWARAAMETWTQQVWDRTGLDTPHRFRVRLVGAIATASAIVSHLGILHFQTDRIVEWLIGQLGQGMLKGTVSVQVPLERAINMFGEFINEHYGETVVVPDRWRPKQSKMVPLLKPHNKLTIRYEVGSQRVYISLRTFRDWALKRGLSPRQVLGALKDHGVVMGERAITLGAGTDIPGAQVMTLEANAAHPVMSGLVAMVTDLHQPTTAAAPASR